MTLIDFVGITAGMLTTISFLPQVIKTWKSRSAGDLSLSMFSIFFTGVALWLVYGIIIGDIAIILANTLTLILSGTILFFKLRY